MRWIFPLIALLVPLQDDEQQVDNVYFKLPAGWKRADQGDLRVLVPGDISKDRVAALYICLGEELKGEFREWFDGAWERLKKEQRVKKVLEEQDVQKIEVGVNEGFLKGATVELENGAQLVLIYFGAKAVHRAESFLFATNDVEKIDAHTKSVSAYRESLSFQNQRPEPSIPKIVWREDKLSPSFTWKEVPPRKGDAGLSGIYRAFLMEEARFAEKVRLTPKYYHWVFFPDGTCYYGMPEEGLINFDLEYWRQKNPEWCGTYTMSGDEGELVIKGQKTTTLSIRRVPEGLSIDKHGPFRPLESCDGLALEGEFRREDWNQGEYSPKGSMTFSKDGTFADDGLLRAAGVSWWRPRKYRKFQEAEAVPGKGKYRISQNSLELIYEDGRKRRVNFSLPKDATREKPDTFVINTWVFVRVK